LWDLRAARIAIDEIDHQRGWNAATVRRHLIEHGGVRPQWGRDLKRRSLSHDEREEIVVL
jgi:hypothetical protein